MATLINSYSHHTITKDGVVTNLKTGKVKATWKTKSGYLCIDIQEQGKATKHYLHRLLAETFLPNPETKRTVNHINGDKLDNSLENLEWATDSENIAHAYRNRLNHCSTRKVTDIHLDQILNRFLLGESLTTIVSDYPFNLSTLSTHLTKYAEKVGKLEALKAEKAKQKLSRCKSVKHKTYTVQMIDLNTNKVLHTFSSLKLAIKHLGKSSSGPISNVLAGRQKSAYGYYWVRV